MSVTALEKSKCMIKRWTYFLGLILLITLISSGFKAFEVEKLEGFHVEDDEVITYLVPTEEETSKVFFNFPFTGKSYVGFKQAIAVKESLGLYDLVNPFGYMGKYQFGKSTLRTVGIYNAAEFLKNPKMQEKAFKALLARNKWELRKEIDRYEGKVIKGVKITESGILAAAHLGGAGSVKSFLRSNGANGFTDGFGTSLRSYMKRFGGYDTSNIVANPDAKVKMN
ncbi:peptidoglycan-binding protein LysM [Flavobacterium sp. 40-81]|mgnify:CR=1 FL=1|uniref:peptidoglycan-binding protein LysM n=2 Tax=Flavobacterium TaxID=237 RepID=UPI000961418F|nr:peptidoglycan-binding protein LysM [Flavobacterium sp. 40-81]OJV67827.1 MAG: peptidoglycan-binding protein LysM [Flavobacterium sp. 40-81]